MTSETHSFSSFQHLAWKLMLSQPQILLEEFKCRRKIETCDWMRSLDDCARIFIFFALKFYTHFLTFSNVERMGPGYAENRIQLNFQKVVNFRHCGKINVITYAFVSMICNFLPHKWSRLWWKNLTTLQQKSRMTLCPLRFVSALTVCELYHSFPIWTAGGIAFLLILIFPPNLDQSCMSSKLNSLHAQLNGRRFGGSKT